MLTLLCDYAISKGLPYEFVEWSLDKYGHEIERATDFDAMARDWRSSN